MSTVLNFNSLEELVQQQTNIVATYLLYNGTVALLYDDVAHTYGREVEGIFVPASGVTSVTGCADKPQLKPWVAKETTDSMRMLIQPFVANPDPLTGIFDPEEIRIPMWRFEEILMEAKAAYKDKSQKAIDVGKIAHYFIEDLLKAQLLCHGVYANMGWAEQLVADAPRRILRNIPDDAYERDDKIEQANRCVVGILLWLRAHNFRPIKAEYKLYSIDYNCAGTTDAKGYMDSCSDRTCCPCEFKDWLVITDWKSSRDFYREYRYQAAAYDVMDEEESGDLKDARVVVVLGKYTGTVKSVVLTRDTLVEDFAAFLGLLAYYERGEKLDELHSIESALKKEAKAVIKRAKEAEEEAAKAERLAIRLQKRAEKEAEKALKPKRPKKETIQ